MGEVILVYKIIPENMDQFDALKAKLEALEPNRLEEEPVAFGLKAFKFTKIIPDGEGVLDKLEKELNDIPEVQSCENTAMSRSL